MDIDRSRLAADFGVLLSWIVGNDDVPSHIRERAEELEYLYFAPDASTEGEAQAERDADDARRQTS